MIQSMTGYSRVEATVGEAPVIIEMRSVNHRLLDVKVRSKRDRSLALDGQVRALVGKHLHRGAIEILIENRSTGDPSGDAEGLHSLNLAAVAHYYESLKSAQKILGLEDKVGLKDVFVFPDVIQGPESGDSGFPDWSALEPIVLDACKGLVRERQREGAHLLDQVSGLVRDLRKRVDEIEQGQPKASESAQKRIREKIEKALMGISLDGAMNQRVAQEVVLSVERSDVSEEIHRLKGHLNHFSEVLGGGGVLGRKLEFLVQEILREVNTIGSKAVDLDISREALQAKSLADQIREQVLNFE